ncbi:MAG: hypothetical protein SAK29_04130 [Scytonema sp. PMC 1069.18]|nr:hypothetical protein [Scytonema sp. PMC 1069.18]MEC4882185.1 hypothetical protein [Scytonema sp. PMC 1070.18]
MSGLSFSMHHAFYPTSSNPYTNVVGSFYAAFLKILTIRSVLSGYTVTNVCDRVASRTPEEKQATR